MDDAASTAHLCCQGGSDRLIGPASFPWISHGNGRSYLNFVMAWSWGCVQRCIQIDRKIKVRCCFTPSFFVLILTSLKLLAKTEFDKQESFVKSRKENKKPDAHTTNMPQNIVSHANHLCTQLSQEISMSSTRSSCPYGQQLMKLRPGPWLCVFIVYTSRFSPQGKRTNASYCRLRQVNRFHRREHFTVAAKR